jgi:hypothetical protein
MTGDTRSAGVQPRYSALVFATLVVAMVAATGGAAERVVLGEYFTNLF